jgi:hypothetical protein
MWPSLLKIQYTELKLSCGNDPVVKNSIYSNGFIVTEDVLQEDKGECVICFEDLTQGDTIARLPCLCIYHKG